MGNDALTAAQLAGSVRDLSMWGLFLQADTKARRRMALAERALASLEGFRSAVEGGLPAPPVATTA